MEQRQAFNEFVKEQIAGDLLPKNDDVDLQQERLTATGFLALGAINYELQDKELLRMEIIDEQIDAVGRAFLGMTVSCARCHDHKFDPIPMRDYYAMAGIFRSTRAMMPGNVSGYVERPLPLPADQQQMFDQLRARVDGLKKQLDEWKSASQAGKQRKAAQDKLNELSASLSKRPVVMAVDEHDEIGDYHLCIRGNAHNLGPTVTRGVLQVCQDEEHEFLIQNGGSGRLELAQWLVRDSHPLTTRVFVNRLWHYLFGHGLVRTTDNFGATGERPSHPELLDFLAHRLRSDDWSPKRSIRRLIRSRVYSQSSKPSEMAKRIDPENRLFARASRRRLDAEAIRDSILTIGDQLDRTAAGLTIRKFSQYDLGYEFRTNRRSVYVPWFRNTRLDLFEVFDVANPNVATGRRNISTLPTQALLMMNSPFVVTQASQAADHLLRQESVSSDEQRLTSAYRVALGRGPTPDERVIVSKFIDRFQAEEKMQAWSGVFHMLFASVDFRYVD